MGKKTEKRKCRFSELDNCEIRIVLILLCCCLMVLIIGLGRLLVN